MPGAGVWTAATVTFVGNVPAVALKAVLAPVLATIGAVKLIVAPVLLVSEIPVPLSVMPPEKVTVPPVLFSTCTLRCPALDETVAATLTLAMLKFATA